MARFTGKNKGKVHTFVRQRKQVFALRKAGEGFSVIWVLFKGFAQPCGLAEWWLLLKGGVHQLGFVEERKFNRWGMVS